MKSESEVTQSCLTLSDPMDCSLPGSSIHGIFQARVWSGLPLPSPAQPYKCISKCYFLYGNVPRRCVLSYFSCVRLFVTLWTIAHQAPLSIGFSRQEHWSGFPCPPPGDLPDPGIKLTSFMSPVLAGGFFTSATWEAPPEDRRGLSHFLFPVPRMELRLGIKNIS